jgi:hypothetical protein
MSCFELIPGAQLQVHSVLPLHFNMGFEPMDFPLQERAARTRSSGNRRDSGTQDDKSDIRAFLFALMRSPPEVGAEGPAELGTPRCDRARRLRRLRDVHPHRTDRALQWGCGIGTNRAQDA